MNDTLITFGGAVKALGNGHVGGYLVRFSTEADPDLTKDFFDNTTNFEAGVGTKVTPYYAHGLDPVMKKRRLGDGEIKRVDEVGVWYEAQLNQRDEYERYIYKMAEAGKLGWSSGTAMHLVEKEAVGKAFHIKTWPLGLDASLTPTPAEPRNGAMALKDVSVATIKDMLDAPVMTYGGGAMAQPTVGNVIRAAMDDALTDIITAALASGVLNDTQYRAMRDDGDAYVDSVLTTLGDTADTPAPYGLCDALCDDDDDDGWKSVDPAAIKAGRKMSAGAHKEMGGYITQIGTAHKGLKNLHARMDAPPPADSDSTQKSLSDAAIDTMRRALAETETFIHTTRG